MSFSVPTNQTTSRTVYGIAVAEACRLPHDFMKTQIARIDRAFQYGEPIHMIVEELKMVFAIRPTWRPTKTPRALAARVVRA
jgi:hypothetical protein